MSIKKTSLMGIKGFFSNVLAYFLKFRKIGRGTVSNCRLCLTLLRMPLPRILFRCFDFVLLFLKRLGKGETKLRYPHVKFITANECITHMDMFN